MNKLLQIKMHTQNIEWKLKDINEEMEAIKYLVNSLTDKMDTTYEYGKVEVTNLTEK